MNYEDEDMMPQDGYMEEDHDEFYDEEDLFYDEEDEFETGLSGMDEDDFYDDEDDFVEEVEYLPAEDYDSFEDEEYDGYKSSSVGMIDSNDRTLTVVITNTGQEAAEAVIFGANEAANQPQGISVDVSESSHQIVRNETFANPFVIKGVKMSVSSGLQFDQVVNITRRTATGSNNVKVWQPRNSSSPQNLAQNLIDDSTFSMEVTPQDSLRFTVLPGVTVVFTFTLLARVNMGNLLKGKNVAELSRTPRTTGLPQLDLLQKKKRKARRRRILRRVPKSRSRYKSRVKNARGRKPKYLRKRR